MIYTAL